MLAFHDRHDDAFVSEMWLRFGAAPQFVESIVEVQMCFEQSRLLVAESFRLRDDVWARLSGVLLGVWK